MIPIINEKYQNLIPQIIESSLKLITKTPKISISTNPENKFDLEALLAEDSTKGKAENDDSKKVNINTAETNELTDSIELINVFIEGFDKHYIPYVEFTEQTIIPLKNYEMNSTVRGSAISVLETLANLTKKHSPVEVFHAKIKTYISVIFETLEKETEYDNVIIMLETLDNIFDCASVFLGTVEINAMFSKLIEIFNKIEKSRIDLIQHKEKQQQLLDTEKAAAKGQDDESDNEFEDDEENLDELEYDIDTLEKVLTGFSNVMGTIFKHHKELCMEVVSKMLLEYLPKYFKDEASTFEKKLGFFILDDMIEFLGQELLYNVWNDIFQILIKYATHNACAIRQAVLYGLGEFAKYTKKDFDNYYVNMMNALMASLDVKKFDTDTKDEYLSAKDNTISSIGKIIKYQGKSINLKETVNKWVNLLPIEVDKVEAFEQYELLCEIILNNSELIVGDNNSNLVKIICLLGKIYKTTFTMIKLMIILL